MSLEESTTTTKKKVKKDEGGPNIGGFLSSCSKANKENFSSSQLFSFYFI